MSAARDASGPPRRTAAIWLATGLGLGFSPVAPGTVGALWGIPLTLALAPLPWSVQLVSLVGLLAIGVPICSRAARDLGGSKDPSAVVWDEFATVPLVFCGVALSQPWVLPTGFALHRLFDILKPPPIRQLERLAGGLGIMADDVVAAGFAWLSLQLILWASGTA